MAILLYNDFNNYNRIKNLENDYLQIVEKMKLEFQVKFVF